MSSRVIKAIYDSAADRMPGVSLDDADIVLSECDVYPIVLEGKVCGGLITKQNEIHACVLPCAVKRWMKKFHLDVLHGVIKRYGRAVTKPTTKAGEVFVKKLGFLPIANGYYAKE